jgi:hypothetical protein
MRNSFLGGLFDLPEQHGSIPVRSERHTGALLVDGSANGAPFTFVIDTGAGGLYFGAEHTRRLGITEALDFIGWFKSPGLSCPDAHIYLDELRLDGGFVRTRVPACITQADLGPLLRNCSNVGLAENVALLGRDVLRWLNFSYARGCATLTY